MSEQEKLVFADTIHNLFEKKFYIYDFITIHNSSQNENISSFLGIEEKLRCYLSECDWNFDNESFLPGVDSSDGVKYFRNCSTKDIEQSLVVKHSFSGFSESYYDLCEEFVLYHNLLKKSDGIYVKFDKSGSETIVARIADSKIEVRIYEIKQFLAAKQRNLVIQYELKSFSNKTLEELKLKNEQIDKCFAAACYSLNIFDSNYCPDGFNSGSLLRGKRIVAPLPIEKCGLYPFEDSKLKFENYLIGTDENDEEIEMNCNPSLLNRNQFLTNVCFKKIVLDKYHSKPSIFTIESTVLYCGNSWSLYLDNEGDSDFVYVFLGDLGSLPYDEQVYWKSFNVLPQGKLSKTFFSQQLLANFEESTQLDFILKQKYEKVKMESYEKLKWQFFLDFTPADQHFFDCIRIPTTDEEKDFDEIVMCLTKSLIDSLNEKSIRKYLTSKGVSLTDAEGKQIQGSIKKLELFLTYRQIEESESKQHLDFLKDLQSIRSTGMAHRKGKDYEKTILRLGFSEKTNIDRIKILLTKGIEYFDFIFEVINEED